MKKLIALILTGALALSLTACGGVSQAEYDRLLKENRSLLEENKSLKKEKNSENNEPNNGSSTNPYSSVKAGDKIQLGGLDWLVINVQDDKALILSDKILENREYHNEEFVDITWENCSLRAFLNGSFYDSTFSAEEKALIVETEVVNSNNPQYRTRGGKDTTDKVFLLSIDEVEKYMVDEARTKVMYAKIAKKFIEDKKSWWWLRSSGFLESNAACVDGDGYVRNDGSFVYDVHGGVRPALWLDLTK